MIGAWVSLPVLLWQNSASQTLVTRTVTCIETHTVALAACPGCQVSQLGFPKEEYNGFFFVAFGSY